MANWDRYLLPKTVDEALSYLACAAGRARVIAGGTDFLLDLRQGRYPPVDTLVDVTGISELRDVQMVQSGIFMGSAVTHREIIESGLLQEHARCLVQACKLIGGSQVRNVATIGGNVAHALPAADGSIALLALNAEAEIASMKGRRWERIEDLFLGPGEAAFDSTQEILLRFRLPLKGENEKTAFQRIMRPQGVAIAILNMALWVRVGQKVVIEDIRLAVGPAGPKPFRARKTERVLQGLRINRENIHKAVETLQSEAKVRSSAHRASKEYRTHLLGVLLTRLLSE